MLRVGAVVAARMGSSRFPGKVLAEVAPGLPVLKLCVDRLRASTTVNEVIVATTSRAEDKPITDAVGEWWTPAGSSGISQYGSPTYCHGEGVLHPHPAPEDVLARLFYAADWYGLDYIVRVTGDCPLVCPEVVDEMVWSAVREGTDYARTDGNYPEGLDVEVLSARALWLAHHSATESFDREHVTPWIKRHIEADAFSLPTHYGGCRLTVDRPTDLEVVRAVVARLGGDCTLDAITALYDAEPALWAQNEDIPRNEWEKDAPRG